MMGDKEAFVTLKLKEERMVTFGDNGKGHIIGIDKIQIIPQTCLENMLYVLGLKHKLTYISQLCDKGYKVSFESSLCIVTNPFDNILFLLEIDKTIYI